MAGVRPAGSRSTRGSYIASTGGSRARPHSSTRSNASCPVIVVPTTARPQPARRGTFIARLTAAGRSQTEGVAPSCEPVSVARVLARQGGNGLGLRGVVSSPLKPETDPMSDASAFITCRHIRRRATMQQATQLFQGVPLPEVRKALAQLMREHPDRWDRVYVPCAGEFAACQVLANHVDPSDIYASDITLFSGVIGRFLADDSFDDLGVKVNDPEDDETVRTFDWELYDADPDDDQFQGDDFTAPHVRPAEFDDYDLPWSEWVQQAHPDHGDDALRGRANYAARILLTQHYFSLPRNHIHAREFVSDLARTRDQHAQELAEKLRSFYQRLGGLHYEEADLRELAIDTQDDERALLFIDPPVYKGGYEQMFDTHGHLEWDEPQVPQFEPSEHQVMLDTFDDVPSDIVYMLYVNDIYDDQYDYDTTGWDRWFAVKRTAERVDYLAANWDTGLDIIARPKERMQNGNIPIWQEGDWLNKHSDVQFVELNPNVAQYYRNLLQKGLMGGTGAEVPGAFLVDGKMVGLVGVNTSHVMRDGSDTIFLVFAIAPLVDLPKSLNRLVVRLVKSADFRDQLLGMMNFGTNDSIEQVRTKCFSWQKTTRGYSGLWEKTEAEPTEDDEPKDWALTYETPFVDKSYQQMIVEFQDELRSYEQQAEAA